MNKLTKIKTFDFLLVLQPLLIAHKQIVFVIYMYSLEYIIAN